MREGQGTTVVFLHGIASDSTNWLHVVPNIHSHCRLIAVDLLGFGDSPKPSQSRYTTRVHANAVIDTLKRLKIKGPIVLVGHSMGSLVAVEVAKRRPRFVRHLILCSMPIYIEATGEQQRKNRDSLYFKIYNLLINKPEFALRTSAFIVKTLPRLVGFSLDEYTWMSFQKSLQHTIMEQTTYDDIRQLTVPIELVCGRFDVFVVRQHLYELADKLPNVRLHMLNAPHDISPGYGKRLAELIDEAVK
jgi:pimeloyl-ACP methyl ester carboxylesterase